ncbi:MAG: dihydrofolate reductase family protein [Deltaproteobacteria bacterium]|nr:dihydrofolate reductase family protein [Deltaproteobacteria bacterium]
MRSIIQLAHVSLDGYVAGPGGTMDFITFDNEVADFVYPLMRTVDTSIYGRTTFEMMEGYWPGILDDANASANEKGHARWYANVKKIVASRTLPAKTGAVTIAGDDIVSVIAAAKREPGGDMMIFASPTLSHTLSAAGLIDEWRLTWQPVIVGGGLPLFGGQKARSKLELRSSRTFASGVVATHHVVKR